MTDEEYSRCELMAKGNKSFYIRQLIRNDISSSDVFSKETIIQIIEDYLKKETSVKQPPIQVKPEHTKMAKQVIADIFNF